MDDERDQIGAEQEPAERKGYGLSPSLRTVIVLFAVTLAMALVLAGVNGLTAKRIEDRAAEEIKNAVELLMPSEELVDFGEIEGHRVFAGKTQGYLDGYAILVSPIGYGGEINMVVSIDAAGSVSGVTYVPPASETPGIGTKVLSADFLKKYIGKTAGVTLGSGEENTVDAISGATITSRAVTKGVAEALTVAAAINGGGGNSNEN